jgi:rhamnose transport system substrate-binding protein
LTILACTPREAQNRSGETPASSSSDRLKIYFIPKNLGNPYFEAISSGFYDAMVQLGEDNFEYAYTGPESAEADSQIPFVEEAIQKKAAAVFIAANSNDALNDVFDKARNAGVRIYLINMDIPGSEAHRDAAIMPVNFDAVGTAQMELLGEQMGYQGDFAILSATIDAPDQNIWISLIQAELKNNPKYQNMKLLEIAYGDDQTEKSTQETERLLKKYPGLGGMLAPTAVGITAACEVIQDRGYAGKIKITGLGLPSEMAEYVLNGTCDGFQLWNPPYEGYIAVFLVWAEKKASFSPAAGASFEAGRLGKFTILPNGQILALEKPMLYDRSNIREYAIQF